MKYDVQVSTPKVTITNGPLPRYTTPGNFKVGQLSQRDSYGKAMNSAYKATKLFK